MSGFIRAAARGALSGFLATVPMTLAMEGMRQRLPWYERYALPPRLITASLSWKTGAHRHLTTDQEAELAWCAHYLFGSSMGAVYSLITPHPTSHRFVRGALFGGCVWALSYQGWLPALDILPPATWHPTRRVMLMVVAHLIWGVALSEIDDYLRSLEERDSTSEKDTEQDEVESMEVPETATAV
jgi:uncharacterized membrane protein YagU involved in acid resistance